MSLARQLLTVLCGLISGACLIATFFLTLQRVLIVPSAHPTLIEEQNHSLILPSSLSLVQVEHTLPLIPTTVENNNWSVSSQGLSLLTTPHMRPSPARAQGHGYIVYGHNWPNLLGKLKESQIGDTFTMEFTDHSQAEYTVQSLFTVSPDRLDVLSLAQDPDMLLLYTCTGWLDQDRLVVLARRTNPEPAPTTLVSQIQ